MVVRAAQAVPNPLLRQAREARNLTQDEVADELIQLGASGVTGGLVSKWERGICRPTAFHRRLLCQFFARSREELGFARGAPAGADQPSEPSRTDSASLARLPAWLSSLEARAHAEMHDARACDAALSRAAERIEQLRPETCRPGVDFFDRPRFVSARGTCHLILGRPEAVPVLTEALSLHPAAHQRYRSLTLLELALAQVQRNEREWALDSATKALAIPKEQRVGELLKRERQLHARLGKWRDEPAVKEVRERLTA